MEQSGSRRCVQFCDRTAATTEECSPSRRYGTAIQQARSSAPSGRLNGLSKQEAARNPAVPANAAWTSIRLRPFQAELNQAAKKPIKAMAPIGPASTICCTNKLCALLSKATYTKFEADMSGREFANILGVLTGKTPGTASEQMQAMKARLP